MRKYVEYRIMVPSAVVGFDAEYDTTKDPEEVLQIYNRLFQEHSYSPHEVRIVRHRITDDARTVTPEKLQRLLKRNLSK